MSNNKKQIKMESIKENNGNLERWQVNHISTYKRGVASIIKRYPQYESELNAVVENHFNQVQTNDWFKLTTESAMNINIAVQNRLGELKPILDKRTPEERKEQSDKAQGEYLARLRASGVRSGLD
jgi:hypothetical protein